MRIFIQIKKKKFNPRTNLENSCYIEKSVRKGEKNQRYFFLFFNELSSPHFFPLLSVSSFYHFFFPSLIVYFDSGKARGELFLNSLRKTDVPILSLVYKNNNV